jgi:hypothetical protein
MEEIPEQFSIIKPFTSLTGLQKFFSLPCCLVIGKFFRAGHKKVTQYLTPFCCFYTMFLQASGKLLGNADIPLAPLAL